MIIAEKVSVAVLKFQETFFNDPLTIRFDVY